MKTLILITGLVIFSIMSNAQVIKKDTVMVDSSQAEKINKMPMDTGHYKMPVKPLPVDSAHRRDIDDIDPDKNHPKEN